MYNSRLLRVSLFVMAFLILATAIVVAITRTSRSQKKPNETARAYEAAKVTAAPQVTSKVKDLEITGVTLSNEGTPDAALVIEVTNHRDQAVMAIDFVATAGSTTSGLGMDTPFSRPVKCASRMFGA
jgi:hypothetical protein